MLDKFKQHWFIALIIICATVAGVTWDFALQILVKPRDFQISRLDKQIAELNNEIKSGVHEPNTKNSSLVLSQTGVSQGSSVTTSDGVCTVEIVGVGVFGIDLSVTIGANHHSKYTNKHPGDRIAVHNDKYYYYIDLHNVRGDIVDISINKENYVSHDDRVLINKLNR